MDNKHFSLLMRMDGEIEEQETEVEKGAAKGTGSRQGQILPSLSDCRP
jgi:hypothetical protein